MTLIIKEASAVKTNIFPKTVRNVANSGFTDVKSLRSVVVNNDLEELGGR